MKVSLFILNGFLILSVGLAQKSDDFQQKGLQLHNKYRSLHGSPSLVLSNELNNLAQKCAEFLAQNKMLQHVCGQKFKYMLGENLAMQSFGNASEAVMNSIKMWYDENPLYNYQSGSFSMETGHFTQVVWKTSAKLGLGFSANDGFKVTVGLYDPPGNMMGQFNQNVQKG